MSTRYYYYPTTTDGRTRLVNRDRDYGRNVDAVRVPRAIADRPATPPLTRASTPSSSGPPTPTLRPISPEDPKRRRRHVEFASPLVETCRRPESDELSVMRAFTSHATYCDSCTDPIRAHRRGTKLCDRGMGLATDLGRYFYCQHGRPHSYVDRLRGKDNVQVEVPPEYGTVRRLFQALDDGLQIGKEKKTSRPQIHQPHVREAPSRPTEPPRQMLDSLPSRRMAYDERYDIRPSRSNPRRQRDTVYRGYGDRNYETRTPYDEMYTSKRSPGIGYPRTPTSPTSGMSRRSPGLVYPRTPASPSGELSKRSPGSGYPRTPTTPTSDRFYDLRRRDDTYYDRRRDDRYRDTRPRDHYRRNNHYEDRESRRRREPSFYFPSFSQFWR